MNYDSLAALYDLQYADYREDLPFYARLADDFGGPVLELGAGTGRVSEALARAGHAVVGVELSGAMLERAQLRLADAGLSERVHLHQGDMRKLDLDQTFPLVIAPFNAYMHAYTLPEQDAVLAAVKCHLKAGGRFALDLYNPRFRRLDVLKREAEWSPAAGERSELFIYQTLDEDAQLITSRYYLDTVLADGTLKRQTATLVQRYSTRFELERALRNAGFTSLHWFGGFDRRRYTAAAPHLIAVAG